MAGFFIEILKLTDSIPEDLIHHLPSEDLFCRRRSLACEKGGFLDPQLLSLTSPGDSWFARSVVKNHSKTHHRGAFRHETILISGVSMHLHGFDLGLIPMV